MEKERLPTPAMLWPISFVLTCAFLFLSPYSHATTSACLGFYSREAPGVRYTLETLKHALSEVPTIREYVLEVMQDSTTPGSIKRIIKRALEDENTKIENLTQELRVIRNLDKRSGAIAEHPPSPYIGWMYDHETPSLNQQVSSKLKPSPNNSTKPESQSPIDSTQPLKQPGPEITEFKEIFRVTVPDRKTTSEINDLNSLIHELSHVRMQAFLYKNWRRIFTPQIGNLVLEGPNGKLGIHLNLQDLIQEKYAHETELSFYKSSQSKYFPQWTQKWNQLSKLSPQDASVAVGLHVSSTYEFSNPAVRALAIEPISKILWSPKVTNEVFSLLDLYSTLSPNTLKASQAPFAVALLRLVKQGKGESVTRETSDSELYLILLDLLNSQNGIEEANQVLTALLPQLETYARSKIEYILTSPEFSQHLGKMGWPVPVDRKPTWKEILEENPLMKNPFNENFFKRDKDSKALFAIINDGLNHGDFSPKDHGSFSSFSDGLPEYQTYVKPVADDYAQFSEFLKIPVSEAKLKVPKLKILAEGKRIQIEAFWSRLGLRDVFLKNFPDRATFWNSSESLLDIYKRLKIQAAP